LETDTLRLLGSCSTSAIASSPTPTRHASFSAGYLQAEYRAPARWTLFGRLEGTDSAKNDPYLDLIKEFLNARVVAGSRFERAKTRR
jgi:hypothetical protein